jgi:nucleotide-binding universal stress UspA family protein
MFEKILLAFDGSEPSTRAMELVRRLALTSGGEVLVFHVVERFIGHTGAVDTETPEEITDLMETTVRSLKDEGVSARGVIVHAMSGRTAAEILEAAKDFGADVVVVGSRGLTDMAGILLGSITHKVIHLADRPVLVVR